MSVSLPGGGILARGSAQFRHGRVAPDPAASESKAGRRGGYPFSHVAGFNFPAALIAWANGEDLDSRWPTIQPGRMAAKYGESMTYSVPMSSPDVTATDIAAVNQVLATRYLSLGLQIEAFEQAAASYVGAVYAVDASSGARGLHLTDIAANVGEGGLVSMTPVAVDTPVKNPSRLCICD